MGQKEDVSDILSNHQLRLIRPCKQCVKTKRYLLVHSHFLEDSLAAAGVNAAVEGATATMIALDPQVERTNTTQILTKGL